MVNVTEKMSEEEKRIYELYRDNFPFPIVEYMNEIGLKVFADKLPDHTSGAITKCDDGYAVIVNSLHSPRRMRFTLAHELGHYFNDKDYLDCKGEITDSSKQSSKWLYRNKYEAASDPQMRIKDIKANQFAAELLMPEEAFIKKWRECSSPEEVADYFSVSVDAARMRANALLGEIV